MTQNLQLCNCNEFQGGLVFSYEICNNVLTHINLIQHLRRKANGLVEKFKLYLPSSKFSKSQLVPLHFSSSLFVLRTLKNKTQKKQLLSPLKHAARDKAPPVSALSPRRCNSATHFFSSSHSSWAQPWKQKGEGPKYHTPVLSGGEEEQ